MLTLSFTHNSAPEKLSQKRWTEKQKHSQENYPVHLLPGEIMSVSAVPKAESNKDLVVPNV